jgi:subtilisin family serine protease
MRRGAFAAVAFAVLVLGATASAATERRGTSALRSASPTQAFVPGEAIVRFKPGLATKAREALLDAGGATLDEELLLPGAALVNLASGESVSAAVAALEAGAGVLDAQPNYVYYADATPSDPFFNLLWGLQNAGQPVDGRWGLADADIDAPEAWDLTTGTDAVKVAVVDSGIEYDHPDLVGNVVGPGWDFYSGDSDPRDENGHGTHVAGTIGANGDNGIGVTGVNWNVGLLPVRVLGPTGAGTSAMIANGFVYAVQQGAKIVNASLGGSIYDPLIAAAIAGAPGTLFVVGAGNGGGDGLGDDNDLASRYPCSFGSANLLCVAATDLSDSLATFSNYGTISVDLAAPGVKIGSTYVAGEYVYLEGTSMATPHVAGVAALLLARTPAATVAQLRAALLGSVDVLGTLGTKVATSGRLNAYRALVALAPPAPLPPPAPSLLPTSPAPQRQPRGPALRACVVPKVAGRALPRARRALRAGGCALGRVTHVYSRRVRKGRVISQSRRPQARLPGGTRVSVVVSRGRRR